MHFFDVLIARSLPFFPRSWVWKVARRYIAGLSVDDAVRAVRHLERSGVAATLDILGENVSKEEAASAAADGYCELLDRVHRESLACGISVKLSQLGVEFSPGLASTLLERVVQKARERQRFVRVDMEDSRLTTVTLEIYSQLASRYPNLGIVLQAYLRRSAEDLRQLLSSRPKVRICKGIYREPPEVAFQKPDEIRENFLKLLDALLEGGGAAAIATHDPYLIERSLARLKSVEHQRHLYEFQMLLGVGHKFRPMILNAGWRLRIYVPFGAHWHAYSLRRLRENPALARYVLKDSFRWRRESAEFEVRSAE